MTSLGAIGKAELLCTVVSDTSTDVIILLKHRYYDFAPALDVDQMVSTNAN